MDHRLRAWDPANAAEAFPVGHFIRDEMWARGWSLADLHRELGGDPVTCCAVDIATFVHDPAIILDEKTAAAIGRAFGTSGDMWLNLDRAWRRWNEVNRNPSP